MKIIKSIYNAVINNRIFGHINKFGIVGYLNTVIDFGLFSILKAGFM